jgi:hypothetical protein
MDILATVWEYIIMPANLNGAFFLPGFAEETQERGGG